MTLLSGQRKFKPNALTRHGTALQNVKLQVPESYDDTNTHAPNMSATFI